MRERLLIPLLLSADMAGRAFAQTNSSDTSWSVCFRISPVLFRSGR